MKNLFKSLAEFQQEVPVISNTRLRLHLCRFA